MGFCVRLLFWARVNVLGSSTDNLIIGEMIGVVSTVFSGLGVLDRGGSGFVMKTMICRQHRLMNDRLNFSFHHSDTVSYK